MICRLCEWLLARRGDDSPAKRHGFVQRHVRNCPRCRHRLEARSNLGGRLREESRKTDAETVPPDNLHACIMARVREAAVASPPAGLRSPQLAWLRVAAAVLLLVAALGGLGALWRMSATGSAGNAVEGGATVPIVALPKPAPGWEGMLEAPLQTEARQLRERTGFIR